MGKFVVGAVSDASLSSATANVPVPSLQDSQQVPSVLHSNDLCRTLQKIANSFRQHTVRADQVVLVRRAFEHFSVVTEKTGVHKRWEYGNWATTILVNNAEAQTETMTAVPCLPRCVHYERRSRPPECCIPHCGSRARTSTPVSDKRNQSDNKNDDTVPLLKCNPDRRRRESERSDRPQPSRVHPLTEVWMGCLGVL